MKKQLTNMRTCYRQELKKKLKSEKSGAGDEDVYEPTLWYFDNLEFLRDQELQLPKISTFPNYDDECNDDSEENTELMKRKRTGKNDKEDFLKKAVDHLDELKTKRLNEKDEATTYAESWAVSYRKLTEEQKLFAKKAIDKFLVLGQLNHLILNVVNCYTPTPTPSLSVRSYSPPRQPSNNAVFDTSEATRNVESGGYYSFTQLMQDSQYQ